MKDQRLQLFRTAVDALTESLAALVRVSRWTDDDAPPEALSISVSKLVERLGVASRLVSTPFQGTPTDMRKVSAMCTAMKRLDAAYVVYRKRVEASPAEKLDAATALEFEISEATGPATSAV
jgi:hypothetical protein